MERLIANGINYAKAEVEPIMLKQAEELGKKLKELISKKEEAEREEDNKLKIVKIMRIEKEIFKIKANFRSLQSKILYCLQCADGNRGQNFSSLNEGDLAGATETENGNVCVILGTIRNVNHSEKETYNAGLKNKDLLNNISLNKKWLKFLWHKFIPIRTDYLNADANIKSSYTTLTWKSQPLFVSEARINPKKTEKLEIVKFDHSYCRSNCQRDKSLDSAQILTATLFRKLQSTADNDSGEFTADGLGHSGRTSKRMYDLARQRTTMQNIDNRRSNITKMGVVSSDTDEEIEFDMEGNQAMNRELKEEQQRLRKAAADEAAPLYTNKKKSGHFAKELIQAVVRMRNPAYAA